jgi:hypothetical protein
MERQMKLLFKMSMGIGLVLLIAGCTSTSGPTSQVGIINGKYAIQTVIPNNNKGKKVNLSAGQSYACETTLVKKNGQKDKVTFDLKISADGKTIVWYNDKVNGKTPPGYYISKLVYQQSLGFIERGEHRRVLMASSDNTGNIILFQNETHARKFLALNRQFSNGKINKSEYSKQASKIHAIGYTCTQTTNNAYISSRYMTKDEIDIYKMNQQIAVQQRAIDSANYNASMARLQAQTAQMNYNTQQMLNSINTYNINVYHY